MPIGRPTKLNGDRAANILKVIRAGSTRKDAANQAGISYNTLLSWLQRGEAAREAAEDGKKVAAAEQPYLDFLEEFEEAESAPVVIANTVLMRAISAGDTVSARWLLERKRPQEFAQAQRVEVTGGEKPVEIEITFGD